MHQLFKSYTNSISIIAGSILLILPALFNGYPLLYGDTATYISAGFDFITPKDRPMAYGLWLNFSSLNGFSIWLTVFFQALLCSWLSFKIFKYFIPNHNIIFLIVYFILLAISPMAWNTSQLMPDIFTLIGLLAWFVLAFIHTKTLKNTWPYWLVFLLATCTHASHLLYFTALSFFLFALRYIQSKSIHKPSLALMMASMLCYLSMSSALAKSKHVFTMGALAERGILKAFLDKHCASETDAYALCAYKDEIPKYGWQFVWEPYSPLYKIGWKESKSEFNTIIFKCFTEPDLVWLQVKSSLTGTFSQLLKFKIGEGNSPYTVESNMQKRILSKYGHDSLDQFRDSYQQKDQLVQMIDAYNFLIYLSSIVFAILLFFTIIIHFDFQKSELITFAIIAIILNAWLCATFANVIDRLGNRVLSILFIVGFPYLISKLINFYKPTTT